MSRSTASELRAFRLKAQQASERIIAGEEGPIFLGVFAEDVYVRLLNDLDSNIKLSWERIEHAPEGTEASKSLGKAYYFGDPFSGHALGQNYIGPSISRGAKALGFWSVRGICPDQHLTIPAGTARLPGATRLRIKNPDYSWWAWPTANVNVPPTAILEVAFKNEGLREFVRELDDWARAGIHAIGIKVWERNISDGLRASILAVAQESGQHTKQVWRLGVEAEAARIELGPVQEQVGSCIDLPARWFGLPHKASDENAKVAFSLETLARKHTKPTKDQGEELLAHIEGLQMDIETIDQCPRMSQANRDVLCQDYRESIADMRALSSHLAASGT
ncbi:unnamed protein product [Jaminaea pallidilutea]